MSGRLALIAAVVVVLAALVAGLLLVGSPRDERARRLDESRLTDLAQLRIAIDLHYRREGALPDSLEQLARSSPVSLRMTEPEGGRLYDYDVIDPTSYRLCATFNFPSSEGDGSRYGFESWAHGAGRQCFRFRVRSSVPEDGPAPQVDYGPVLEGAPDSSP